MPGNSGMLVLLTNKLFTIDQVRQRLVASRVKRLSVDDKQTGFIDNLDEGLESSPSGRRKTGKRYRVIKKCEECSEKSGT